MKDGGAAFPWRGQPQLQDGTWAQDIDPGMTLRQWYAGQALQGMLAGTIALPKEPVEKVREAYAHSAFVFADLMIAREEEENG